MAQDVKAKVGKMIFHINTENRAAANRELKDILNIKVQNLFDEKYKKVVSSFSKENK